MARRAKQPPATITIDGFELVWTPVRETQWRSENDYQGVTVSVRLKDAVRKELLIKYPFLGTKANGKWHLPEKLKITPEIVAAGIRAAIAAGYDPESRGKTFHFHVPEETD
ncbi:MAG: hypothetical protein ACREHE_16865 [Rhizomicrobium sp.]